MIKLMGKAMSKLRIKVQVTVLESKTKISPGIKKCKNNRRSRKGKERAKGREKTRLTQNKLMENQIKIHWRNSILYLQSLTKKVLNPTSR